MVKIVDPTKCKGAVRQDIHLLGVQVVIELTGKRQSTVYEWGDDRRPDVTPTFRDLCIIVEAVARIHKKEAASARFLQEMIFGILRESAPAINEMKSAVALTRCAGDISVSIFDAKTPADKFYLFGKLNEAEDHVKNLKLCVSQQVDMVRSA